ncbi:hypothetical protein [Neobacillus niacini]|uniref:hypothetical protein n=1 Tax=Neobacillus niacini TaxID=86668 RepID=UPI0039831E9B
MTRKILTYQAPSQLFRSDSLFQQEYGDCLHIAATSSLKSGLGESLAVSRWFSAPIITFRELFTELAGPRWSSSKAQLRQFLFLSDVLADLWNADSGKNRLKLQAMERNQLQILQTLRVLTELGIKPYHISLDVIRDSSSEILFLQIWKKMFNLLTRDSSGLHSFLNADKQADELLKDALRRWSEALLDKKDAQGTIHRTTSNIPLDSVQQSITSSLEKKSLILHGFYFITPIQQRVFNELEKDYELIFLNTYDERFPNTFETVKDFLGIGVFETLRSTDDDVPIHPLAVKLIESLEGGSSISIDSVADRYVDLPHFIQSEKARLRDDKNGTQGMGYQLITPRAKQVEEQLIANEFVPFPKNRKKLTDYPVGRFLYRLHQIKSQNNNVETGKVTFAENITSEILLDCFSSGCLFVKGEDMRNYVKSLERILPYCEGVNTFDQWFKRIESLENEKASWEEEVLKKNSKSLSDRIHRFHSFPMRLLSYFSVETEDLIKIKSGIEALYNIHSALFSDFEKKKVNMTVHLQEIERLVLKNAENSFEGEEKEIVRKIIADINNIKDTELEFSLKDISKGLLFYLKGTLEELAGEENFGEKVYSFDSADAAPFRSNRNFHLAFADQKALPISQDYNIWPISSGLLSYLEKSFPELTLLTERKQKSNSITRYLLYVLFHSADDIRISFTENLGKESRLQLALYLKLIGFKTLSVEREPFHTEELSINGPDSVELESLDWTDPMVREAQVCPKRAAFSFILNEQTMYHSDFHHGFLYTKFVTVMNRMEKGKKNKFEPEEFRPRIDKWFPQWNNMKKDFLFDYITTSKFAKPTISKYRISYDEKSYSAGMTYLNLLPTGYADKGKDNVIPIKDVALHEACPGKHCKYCPYASICRDAIYSLDFEDD